MSARAPGGPRLRDQLPGPTLRRASRMGHQHQQIALMPTYKSFDPANRVIKFDDRLLNPQAEFARHGGLRRAGSDHERTRNQLKKIAYGGHPPDDALVLTEVATFV